MSTDTDKAVDALLAEHGITYDAIARGEHLRDGWQCDAWNCGFGSQGRIEGFDYFTGLGLRAPATKHERARAAMRFPGMTPRDVSEQTLYGRRYLKAVEELRRPVAPSAASVLHSLLLESSAVGQSFESWASGLGYDTDSRKAEETYRACQQNADKLARVIPAAVRAKLAELLEDY